MNDWHTNTLLKNILTKGYFPKELPPCFNTESFGEFVFSNITLPKEFVSEEKPAKACTHNFARAGSLHRKLTLVNPVPFFHLARCISDNWAEISKSIQKSGLSISIPKEGNDAERAVVPSKAQSELVDQRARSRVSYSSLLKADIANFYPTIYTHSIPWALHGKVIAKNDRSDHLIGNKIDRLVRNCQDEQTMGIPIGPDTSLVLAELVLSALDERLQKQFAQLKVDIAGFRYYDDYELSFASFATSDRILAFIQQFLGEFELALNPKKTEIISLPSFLEFPWVHEIRTFVFRDGSAQRSDLINFFELIFELVKGFPDQHIVKYALTRLYGDNLNIRSDNWQLVETLLLQTMMLEPGGIAAGTRVLLEQQQLDRDVEVELVKNTLQAIISRQAPRGHSSEIAWALWTANALKVKMSDEISEAITAIDDSVVALLALDSMEKGLLKVNPINLTDWKHYLRAEELYGSQWLLSYEAGRREWMGHHSYINSDECFGFLNENKVTFYTGIGVDPLKILEKKLESMSPFEYKNYEPEFWDEI